MLSLSCLSVGRAALAQSTQVEAKRFFDAGAAAYAAGDYRAAIQAFEAANTVKPLPAIDFSLAQAERREYFASHEPRHLERAIELFQKYLRDVKTGGRRADATDALAQLEPLAAAQAQEDAVALATATAALSKKTRLMVRSPTPNARISLDGAAGVPTPLIAETTPGPHRIRVKASGYFSVEERTRAVSGALVPIEISLRERPAFVTVDEGMGADIYVDGTLTNAVAGRLELAAGRHWIQFAKKGHRLTSVPVTLGPGETRHVGTELSWTRQRVAAVTLLGIGGASVVAGLTLTGFALRQESRALDIDAERDTGTITPSQRTAYEDAAQKRDRLRIGAITALSVGAGSVITGLFLHQFDRQVPREGVAPQIHVNPAPTGAGACVLVSGKL